MSEVLPHKTTFCRLPVEVVAHRTHLESVARRGRLITHQNCSEQPQCNFASLQQVSRLKTFSENVTISHLAASRDGESVILRLQQ